jgi:outer membrane protein assembly factor BamB
MPTRLRVAIPLATLLAPAALDAADWPRWRGPGNDGAVPAGAPVPKSLPAEPKVLWKIPVGDGFSSPVVAAGKVFHLDNQQGKEVVHALDAATGKELWSAPLDEAFKDGQTAAGPRCSPVVDGDRVYVQSCKGELQCLDAATGKAAWHVNYVKDFGATFIGEKGSATGASRHGNNGAPLVDGDRLLACVGGPDAGVVCFDKKTGKPVWNSQSDVPGYTGPVVATIAGVKQVIAFTAEGVVGLDAAKGGLLWRVPVKTSFGRHVTTPVVAGDMVVVSSHQAGLLGIKVTKEGGAVKAETAWTSKEAVINFACPVAVGNFLYGVGPARNLVCVDVRSGKTAWSQKGIFGPADRAYGGLIVAGENLLVLTDGGQLLLVAADPAQFKEVARAQVCGQNWCNPAYADGRLYVRDNQELRCVQLLP